MGKLLSILCYDNRNDPLDQIFVDFENCKPTESEKAAFTSVQVVLDHAASLLDDLSNYADSTDVIRQALQHFGDEELQKAAWESVLPSVSKLKKFCIFSERLGEVIPQLLNELCSDCMTVQEHLENQQALFKQFSFVIDFSLRFDELKMQMPAIQNDFSFYRRTLSKPNLLTLSQIEKLDVDSSYANQMSMFFAYPTPMLKTVVDATTKFVEQKKSFPISNTTDSLSAMAKICRVMIENPQMASKFENEETKWFCLRVMVGVIIVYDHVNPSGAFSKTSSNIDMKSSIRILKNQDFKKSSSLLNALRYSTKHLNDEQTPKAVRNLLCEPTPSTTATTPKPTSPSPSTSPTSTGTSAPVITMTAAQ